MTTAPATSPATPAATRAQRAAAIKAEADSPSQPAAETTEGKASLPFPSSSVDADSAAGSGGEDPKAKAAADRAARIEAMRGREREKQARRQAHKASRAEQEELAQLRQMKAEWEKNDSAFKDEEAFLSAAEARGIGAEKVIAYFRDRMTNPEAIAERRAEAAKSEVQKQLDEMRNELRQRDEQVAQQRAEVEYQQKTLVAAKNFIALSQARAEGAPLTAAMYAKHGADTVIGFANRFIVPLMPEGFDIEEPSHLEVLHDHMEQFLSETQFTGSPPANTTADTSSKANAGKKNGEKPVTTLSNRVVSERGTVTEEIPLAKLPLKERQRILKEKYEREDQ